eukprot:TRINITY_DN73585_c0_g1_i1.p1 TRINITY_DN73585_c0_g1~~TRINITY_DN73585_c0_g1_i1.p1  ORF type:complete len:105 (-),score=1.92 TRINITY_DN73585_c0_g1_i1:145-459(-)
MNTTVGRIYYEQNSLLFNANKLQRIFSDSEKTTEIERSFSKDFHFSKRPEFLSFQMFIGNLKKQFFKDYFLQGLVFINSMIVVVFLSVNFYGMVVYNKITLVNS